MNRRHFLRSATVATLAVPVLPFPFGLAARAAAPLRRATAPLDGPIVYVSMVGADGAAGTSAAPVRRLQEALSRIREQLPVELVSFDVVADGTALVFRWTTASETNNAGFHIEHQAPQGWREVAYVHGHGTTSESQTYRYRIDTFAWGGHRFRLRQVDHDGGVTYSPSVEVAVRREGVRIMPNPARDVLRIEGLDPEVPATLHDALGRKVLEIVPDGGISTVDVSGLSRGVYFLRTRTGSHPVHLL